MRRNVDAEDQGQQISDLPELKVFDQKAFHVPDTVMYSTYDPEFLLKTLADKLSERDAKVNVNTAKWKLNYEEQRDLKPDAEGQIQEGGYVNLKVKITQIDEERVAIEFKKLGGSAFFFRDQIQCMKDILSPFNDTIFESPEAANEEPIAQE